MFCLNNVKIYDWKNLPLSASYTWGVSVLPYIMLKIMVWKQTILCFLACFLEVSYFSTSITGLRHSLSAFAFRFRYFNSFFFPLLQNFLAANSQCWWNTPLTAATRSLKYAGHVAPGMLLVTAEPCALEILRGAYARSVLKPPATYTISSVGESQKAICTPNF